MSKKILVPEDPNVRHCSMCGKEFEKESIVVKDQDLCPECRKQCEGMAYIYCNTCKEIVTRVNPGLAACGHMILPGSVLHVNECPSCHPAIIESIPVEFKDYEKGR